MTESSNDAAGVYASQMIKALKEKAADNVDVRNLVSTPIEKTLKVMKNVKRNADMEYCDGGAKSCRFAYQLYFRIIIIVLEKLPKHPQYSLSVHAVKELRNLAGDALEQAEHLKPRLKSQFVDLYLKREKKQQEAEQEKLDEEGAPTIAALEGRLEALRIRKGQRAAMIAAAKSNSVSSMFKPSPSGSLRVVPSSESAVVPTSQNKPSPLYPSIPDIPLEEIERSDGLRTVYVPDTLVSTFLSLAKKNSDRNVETCGFLAGVLRNGELHTTALLIPPQTGQPDSCEPTDDLSMFTYMESNNCIQIGWIHTHPSQTAFLSSVDLHTHAGFQIMLKEAIAIVCSVKYNDTQIFNLTMPHGLNTISSCHQTGFHPHQQTGLFEPCKHVVVKSGLPLDVKDWRQA